MVRSINNVFGELTAAANLGAAWETFCRGKRARPTVAAFAREAPQELQRLRRELIEGRYRPGPYRVLFLHEPKRRLIAAADVRDRVVHHAIHRVLAPRLDRSLVDQTYACLEGRGTHRAVLAFQRALRRHAFVLLLDIRHYFLSIDPSVLEALLRRRIKDEPTMALLTRIIEGGRGLYDPPEVRSWLGLDEGRALGRGLPIGNLTSQWWGNHYLSGLDHFFRRNLGVEALRYMDDIAIFGDQAGALVNARDAAARWLAEERHLNFKHPRAPARSTRGVFGYLGCRVSRDRVTSSRRALTRFRQRLGALMIEGETEQIERSIASYAGLLRCR
ncbi:MAG: RNA-directed DNA polymerase [Planctomycetota bacterium]